MAALSFILMEILEIPSKDSAVEPAGWCGSKSDSKSVSWVDSDSDSGLDSDFDVESED
jgi:hypothetical protein